MTKRIALWIALLAFGNTVFADTENIVPDSVIPFENAKVLDDETLTTRNYIIALGSYEKIGNLWEPEKKQRLAGALRRQTHEISRDYDELDVYEYYISEIGETSEVLYSCERFNCGASNNWANVHFGIKQLYGLDRDQFYQVMRVEPGVYATVYVVRRGNGRIYAQIEMINTNE